MTHGRLVDMSATFREKQERQEMQTNFLALTILYTNIMLTHIILLEAQLGILNMLLISARPQCRI